MAAGTQPHVEIVRTLLALSADPNIVPADLLIRTTSGTLVRHGGTALAHAARRGHVAIVQTLLDARADPNPELNSPLMAAASVPEGAEVVRTLAVAGANLN